MQNKTQYNLDRQNAKISALSPENIGKSEFLTDEYGKWQDPNWHCKKRIWIIKKDLWIC